MSRRWMTILMSMLLLLVSACGQQATTAGGSGSAQTAAPAGAGNAPAAATRSTGTTMDHGTMPMDATSTTGATMDHGTMGSAPFDAQFIDSMIEHHNGAIAMAEQALTESERPEIKELAQNIITSQRQEVEQMTAWREQWYPDLAPTGGMGMAMGDMELSSDTNQPFDQRFIAAMIGHHNGAISMAREALTKAEHPEIKQLAEAIIKAQEAEVAQMQQWNTEWFGGS